MQSYDKTSLSSSETFTIYSIDWFIWTQSGIVVNLLNLNCISSVFFSVLYVDTVPFSAPRQIQAFLIASPKISFVTDLMTASMDQMSVLAHLLMRDEVRIKVDLFKFKIWHLVSSYCSNNWIAGMLRLVRHCPWLHTEITVCPVTHVMFPCTQKSPASC